MNGYRDRLGAERGSVYLLAILVLLILTILGLALTLATQSEMQLGRNEELSKLSFYSAETGVAIATAKALIVPDLRSAKIDLVEPTDTPDLNVRNRLEISPFTPVQSGPCDLCQVNEDALFSRIQHIVAVKSTRIAWEGDGEDPPAQPVQLAHESLGVMVTFHPWRVDSLTAIEALTDERRGALREGL